MTIEARIRELGNRHRSLDETIQQEARRPTADPIQIRELKQRKLRLKEEITSLEPGFTRAKSVELDEVQLGADIRFSINPGA